MADHMLTITEARERGLSPDPLAFRDVTDRVDINAREPDTDVRFFESRFYFVIVHEIIVGEGDDEVDMTWLSIRRNDRKALQDWRHLQRIKNELTDPEREAVQLHPAESRLVDESNQTHLWVFPLGFHLPFGYANRMIMTATEIDRIRRATGISPVQRAFEPSIEEQSRSSEELLDHAQVKPVNTRHRLRSRVHPPTKETTDATP